MTTNVGLSTHLANVLFGKDGKLNEDGFLTTENSGNDPQYTQASNAEISLLLQDDGYSNLSSDEKLTFENALTLSSEINGADIFKDIPSGIASTFSEDMKKLTTESATGSEIKNITRINRAYNSVPQKQDDFANAFWPVVHLAKGETHIKIKDTVAAYYTGKGKETVYLSSLVRDPSFLVGQDHRLWPLVNDNNKDDLYAPGIVSVDGKEVAPILFGRDVDILRLTADEGRSSGSDARDVRALAPNIKLDYIQLDNNPAEGAAANEIKTVKIDVSNIMGNTFTSASEGKDAAFNLSMNSVIKIAIEDILDGNAVPHSTNKHKVELKAFISGSGNLDTAILTTNVSKISILNIYDAHNKVVAKSSNTYTTIMDLVKDLEIRAFMPEVYEENSNLAVQGRIFTSDNDTIQYEIGYETPNSIIGAFANLHGRNDVDILAKSVSNVGLTTSAVAVNRLLLALEETKYAFENDTGHTLKGMGNRHLKAFHKSVPINLKTAVSNMESKDIEASITQALKSAVKKVVLTTLRESNFEAAASNMAPGREITIVIGTDTTLASYLLDSDEEYYRISKKIKVKVVSTPNQAMDDRVIGVIQSVDAKGVPDSLSFGLCGMAPTIVVETVRTVGDEQKRVITAIPKYKHHVNANVMFELNITGLDSLLNG